MEILQVAGPALSLVVVVVIILVLWMIHGIDRRLRVLQDHLDSLRREVGQLDEGMNLLSTRGNQQAKEEPLELPEPPPAPEDLEV